MRCCPKADARKITHEEHEDARQLARDIAKTKQYVVSMRLRKKVEMLFAHLKRILRLPCCQTCHKTCSRMARKPGGG